MRTIISLTLSVLLWSSILLVTPASANMGVNNPPEIQCNGDTQTGSNNIYGRVEYTISYNQSTQRVCIIAEATGERKAFFGYSVWVDGSQISSGGTKELVPDEIFRWNQTITAGIDATRDNHTVEVQRYNGTTYFNFTQKIDTTNEGGVPTPHFENVIVKRNGTKSGQPRLMMEVENEGIRTYVPEAEVRTFESDSRRLDNRYSVRLSEDNDDVIVGTIRLYGGKFNPGTKFDRVSFVSYPNGTLETWEPEFGEIPTDREIEEREVYYENETAREKYRGPDVDPISERASRAGAVLVTALVVGGLWYWRRRKPR